MQKIQFIIAMLEMGLQPVFSDLDVVWLRDPRPFLASIHDVNLLVSTDSCKAQQATVLDNCPELMGKKREVKGQGTYVGTMNVSSSSLQDQPVTAEYHNLAQSHMSQN